MALEEITVGDLNPERFIEEQVAALRDAVGDGLAINALSGGVDSSVVTLLGHRALGERLKTVFIENGLMRTGEPEYVVAQFEKLGVKVELVDCREQFFSALEGLTDPEEKREAVVSKAEAYLGESRRSLARGERPNIMCPLNVQGL